MDHSRGRPASSSSDARRRGVGLKRPLQLDLPRYPATDLEQDEWWRNRGIGRRDCSRRYTQRPILTYSEEHILLRSLGGRISKVGIIDKVTKCRSASCGGAAAASVTSDRDGACARCSRLVVGCRSLPRFSSNVKRHARGGSADARTRNDPRRTPKPSESSALVDARVAGGGDLGVSGSQKLLVDFPTAALCSKAVRVAC